jgi:hypothetical protein
MAIGHLQKHYPIGYWPLSKDGHRPLQKNNLIGPWVTFKVLCDFERNKVKAIGLHSKLILPIPTKGSFTAFEEHFESNKGQSTTSKLLFQMPRRF